MRLEDVPEYAAHVVGFPILPGMTVIVEEECIGTAKDGCDYTSDKGAEASVLSVELLPLPDQLTVKLRIAIDPEKDLYIEEIFTEYDKEPTFPFVLPTTPEQIELERAEAAARAEAKPATTVRPQQEQPAREPFQDEGFGHRRRIPPFGCH